MPMSILKNIGHFFPFKTMASVILKGKCNTGEWFSWLEAIVSAEHVGRLCQQSKSIFADAIVMALAGALSFWEQTEYIANTRILVFRARWGIINHTNDAFGQEAHLHQFIHTHTRRREEFQCEEAKGRCNVKRFHWDQYFSCSLLGLCNKLSSCFHFSTVLRPAKYPQMIGVKRGDVLLGILLTVPPFSD